MSNVTAWKTAILDRVTTAESAIDALEALSPLTGAGSPEGAVTASPYTLYIRTDGTSGTMLYVKKTGTATNTGWVAV